MYTYIMHYLNFFLSCSIRNLTLASLSRLFTIKIDMFFLLQIKIDVFSLLQVVIRTSGESHY